MDSITQFTLGAAVGEAVLGKKIGNKAILLGGLAGTIPDLDVIFNPFFTEVQKLIVHRGLSHSIIFWVFGSILFAGLFKYLFDKFDWGKVSFKRWYMFTFLTFSTHTIIDCFTTYGTMIFYPFSQYRVAFHNIFIVDLFYTIPLLIGVIVTLFISKTNTKRFLPNIIGITLSSLYIVWSLYAQNIATQNFEIALENNKIEYNRQIVGATPFNTFLWYNVAETDDGFYFGYYSIFDKKNDINFSFSKSNHHLLDEIIDNEDLQTVLGFADYYVVRPIGKNALNIFSAKFGKVNLTGEEAKFLFPFKIDLNENDEVISVEPDQTPPETEEISRSLDLFWKRIWGI